MRRKNQYKDHITLTARILTSAIFIVAAMHKIFVPDEEMGYMKIMGMGMPAVAFLPIYLVSAITIELSAGLMILLGYQMKYAAYTLFIFLVPVTLIFHHQFGDMEQMAMFMKNLAIMGALLLLSETDPGVFSIDARLKKSKESLS